MNFQDAEIDNSSTPNNKSKVLGVIVLTDNRQTPPQQPHISNKFRNSAFRQTDADPLDLNQPPNLMNEENFLNQLSQRVAFLEARVEALSKNEVLSQSTENEGLNAKKKNRRRFRQLLRDKECRYCKKVYGSQTSLKYHLKLKHRQQQNHSQVQ